MKLLEIIDNDNINILLTKKDPRQYHIDLPINVESKLRPFT